MQLARRTLGKVASFKIALIEVFYSRGAIL